MVQGWFRAHSSSLEVKLTQAFSLGVRVRISFVALGKAWPALGWLSFGCII